jgi:hypothetical protein
MTQNHNFNLGLAAMHVGMTNIRKFSKLFKKKKKRKEGRKFFRKK